MTTDTIIIGAGHNGLTTAAYLARSGQRVVVLERRDVIGGVAAREQFHPGYRVPGLLHDTATVRPLVVSELGLEDHGLGWRDAPSVYAPEDDRPGLVLCGDNDACREEIARRSKSDADAYPRWRELVAHLGAALAPLLDTPAIQATSARLGDLWATFKSALRVRRTAGESTLELLRIMPMSLADWLGEWFQDELLKSTLAAPALVGARVGPRAPGTAAMLLLRHCVAGREVTGGPGALITALESCCKSAGVDVRTKSRVHRIRIGCHGVEGVELEDGTHLDAPRVISSCDPKQTFLQLIAPGDISPELDGAIRHWRTIGSTAKVHLAMGDSLQSPQRPGDHEAWHVGGTLDDLERAADCIKYRRMSDAPILDVRVPSLSDPSLAPNGGHVVSILAHFAPYDLDGGWDNAAREALGERVAVRLAHHAPGLVSAVVAREVLTPADLEARFGLSGGQVQHGDHGLDQILFQRPTPACSHHATPLHGLYLCGSGSHPSGAITAAPGRLAARRVLGEGKRS